jgi:hypothetical protein
MPPQGETQDSDLLQDVVDMPVGKEKSYQDGRDNSCGVPISQEEVCQQEGYQCGAHRDSQRAHGSPDLGLLDVVRQKRQGWIRREQEWMQYRRSAHHSRACIR